nr:hypothetical protein [Tanacetum cinerariifolium]
MVVYQMDVKTAFLNGNLWEEDYVSQPNSLELCDLFANLICSKFKMSMMGKISFFLGLQISQSPKGIFINQSKYALESLKKYGFESCDPVDTPMVEKSKLNEDKEGKADSSVALTAFADTDHAGCQDTYQSTSGTFADADHAGCQDNRRSTSGSVENGVIELSFINTEYQLADLFTKALGRDMIEFLTNKLGMRRFTPETLKKLMNGEDETMATTIEQQVALDEALVPSAQRLRIGRSNFRLPSDIQSKELTLQVIYDVLRRSPFFRAFLVTADVPKIYMQEFWATAKVHQHSIRFKMDTKKHIVDLESFREMLHISPRVSDQSFAELPFEEEILEFLRFLGHSAQIKTLTDVNVNKLYQPWRSFAVVINKCLTRKSTGFDSLRLSQTQILWGLYHRRNVDYAFLIWEDLMYQVEHKNQKKSNEMYYPRFTKVIIHYFMTKKPSIPRRNRVNWHYVRDDILNTTAYKEYYACATKEAAPKPKASARKKKGGSAASTTPSTPIATPTPTTTIVAAPRLSAAAKGTDEGTGSKSGVPDVPSDDSEEEFSWNSFDDEDVDEQTKGRDASEGEKTDESDDDNDDQEEAEKGNDDDDDEKEVPKIDEQDEGDDEATESDRESEDEETREQEKESFDPIPQTPEESEDDENNKEDHGLRIGEEERMHEEEEADELYRDVDINQGRGLQVSQETEDSHVILTPTQVKLLEVNFSNLSGIVNQYMHQQMPEAVREAVQTQTDRLQDSIQRENDEFLKTIDEIMKKIIKEQAEVLTKSSHSSRTSYAVTADLSEMELKKILIDKMEGNNEDERMMIRKDPPLDQTGGLKYEEKEGSMHQLSLHLNQLSGVQADLLQGLNLNSCLPVSAEDQPIVQTSQHPEWFSQPSKPLTPDRDWNKSVHAAQGNAQSWISALTKQTDARSSFNELLDTPIDFSNFIMNRLGIDTLTPELLAGPTYKLMRGSCNSQTELEYYLEDPLPLVPNNQGRRVIPFEHFINNDLEYLRGGTSSRKYTTSVTKTKAADYGHIKWIEDLFYGFTVNRESALDVYSNRRIIAVTELKIMEWHNYKHLDWISVRRDDDKIYKFKEGDFKRLRLQDIKDMLLLLVQGKLSNLTVEERFAFNVSLRMFTRSIIIQRRVDETLNDVLNALDDRLKGIRMQYLPTTIWRKRDKDRAAALIQATEKMLKTRRIMRSLERYHFIKEQVENGVIELYFINTEYQLADLFTKALGRDRIEFLTNKQGMRSFTPEMLKKLMNDEDE